jgi:Cu/Ag efflux protein CusF
MNSLFTAASALIVFAWSGVAAVADGRQDPRPGAGIALAQADASMTDGEVRKVDKGNRKITLKHGEIKHLNMPGMTMVFQVKDPALLDRIKPGDKVRFHAEQVNDTLIITTIEPAS